MKKIFLVLILIVLSVAIGLNWNRNQEVEYITNTADHKNVLLRFALICDSENDNDLLEKALNQAKGSGVNFVIGLGDWSNVGTVEELDDVKKIFDDSGLTYYLTAGDHDLWDSRNRGEEPLQNFRQIFGEPTQFFKKEGIQFVILDNSDIYKGISDADWVLLRDTISGPAAKLTLVFSHKTPFHPQSAHVMGEDNAQVADQAKQLMSLLEQNKVDGFFSGDLHFFAQFNSPSEAVKMTTVGAVASERNFQGPRFAVVTVYSDHTWEVENVEIR